MGETPFFSVVVPAYNVENYIENTIRSILGQSCPDYELILVNDGSTDGTGGICMTYARSFPQKIRYIHQKNRGVSGARNTGIEAAKGCYLIFADGDDCLVPTTLQEMKTCLLERHADVLYCDFRRTAKLQEEDISDQCKTAQIVTRKECVLRKLKEKTIPAVAACYSKDLIEKDHIRFNEELSFVEDALFFFTCVQHAEDILYYPAVLYCYVQRTDSATHRKDSVLREIRDELKGWGKIKSILPRDREINKLLIPRIRKIKKGYIMQLPVEMVRRCLHKEYKKAEK